MAVKQLLATWTKLLHNYARSANYGRVRDYDLCV